MPERLFRVQAQGRAPAQAPAPAPSGGRGSPAAFLAAAAIGAMLIISFLVALAAAAPAAEPIAKRLFGREDKPATAMTPAPIGSYAKGCLAGGVALPVDGAHHEAMRLSRNRNWGHPTLVKFVERLAEKAPSVGWRGLLVGDMAQPRGGPMLSGHSSHQIGLDVDIWLRPMAERRFTRAEREKVSSWVMTTADSLRVRDDLWTPGHFGIIRAAAQDPTVARIFVHPAIKKKLCVSETGDRAWLRKVRPWWGHNAHFHVRLSCPPGTTGRGGASIKRPRRPATAAGKS